MSISAKNVEDTISPEVENTMPKSKIMTRSMMRASRSSVATATISPASKSNANPEEAEKVEVKQIESEPKVTEEVTQEVKSGSDDQKQDGEDAAKTAVEQPVLAETAPEPQTATETVAPTSGPSETKESDAPDVKSNPESAVEPLNDQKEAQQPSASADDQAPAPLESKVSSKKSSKKRSFNEITEDPPSNDKEANKTESKSSQTKRRLIETADGSKSKTVTITVTVVEPPSEICQAALAEALGDEPTVKADAPNEEVAAPQEVPAESKVVTGDGSGADPSAEEVTEAKAEVDGQDQVVAAGEEEGNGKMGENEAEAQEKQSEQVEQLDQPAVSSDEQKPEVTDAATEQAKSSPAAKSVDSQPAELDVAKSTEGTQAQ